jgi:KDO2-lipid IV(A) lauroyltransferase
MTLRRKIRAHCELGLVKFALLTLPRVPRAWIIRLARGLGSLAFWLARRDRRIALANLNIAYGETLSRGQKRAIARQSFQTIALVILDIVWFSRRTRERIARHLRIESAVSDAASQGGLIVVTAHLGNWEVMGQGAARAGIRIASVAKPLANPAVDELFNAARRATGQVIVPRDGALRRLLQFLKDGGKIALLLDQDTRIEEGGVFVEFFGLPVPISQAPAALAIRLKVPVMPTFCRREARGDYRVYGLPPVRAAEGETPAAFTQRITALLEEEIRRHPGEWLWMYKRWKRIAPGAAPETYPFYADR